MPKEALASLKEAIGEANIQPLEYDAEDEDEDEAEGCGPGDKAYASWKKGDAQWKSEDELSK